MYLDNNNNNNNKFEVSITEETSVKLLDKARKAILEVEKVVLGKKNQVELMFVALFAGGHVLLDDVPGLGKTTLARAMSSVLGLKMKRIQFTSDLMPSDILGINIINRENNSFVFKQGPIFTNILLADEINRASPRTQSALLEAMEEKQVTIDNETYKLNNPFWVIATQNPVDLTGTFQLPDSQMDRFMFQMQLGYPDKENEIDLLMGKSNKNNISCILNENEILKIREIVLNQEVSERVAKYIVELVNKTRNREDVVTGLSPRSSLSILKAAKANSWLSGRKYVNIEDIQKVFLNASIHRITIKNNNNNDLKKIILEEIIKNVSY